MKRTTIRKIFALVLSVAAVLCLFTVAAFAAEADAPAATTPAETASAVIKRTRAAAKWNCRRPANTTSMTRWPPSA